MGISAGLGTGALTPGLVLVGSKSVSNASTLQLDGCFNSTYDTYFLSWSGTYPTSSTGILYYKLVDGTTPDSTSLYYHHKWSTANSSSSVAFSYGGPSAYGELGLTGTIGFYGTAHFFNPAVAAPTTYLSDTSGWSTNDNYRYNISGIMNTSTAYEGIHLYSAANITMTLNVYGLRK